MKPDLYTVVCDYRGGTYVSQVEALDSQQAIEGWATLLQRNKDVGPASDSIADSVLRSMREDGPVPLAGLHGIWCVTANCGDDLVLCNIVRTL